MGCRNSKTKSAAVSDDESAPDTNPSVPDFMKLVNTAHHPVARKTLEEWSIFVDAHTRRRQNARDTSAIERLARRPAEVWATDDEADAVSHISVDEVGKSFLEYLRKDLVLRGWAGEFDYTVAGVVTQGYLRIAATIDMGETSSGTPDEHPWEMRIHYHSLPMEEKSSDEDEEEEAPKKKVKKDKKKDEIPKNDKKKSDNSKGKKADTTNNKNNGSKSKKKR
mmetsp:Transcript_71171/g.82807  ORF Transcript_71171/g.82807 Transcript_71171/m.82807 type:complete len:222 (-) Transcript_71171:166-831(-)